MPDRGTALAMIAQEARALLTRLDRVRPFIETVPMVLAAAVSPEAQTGIEQHMSKVRQELAQRVQRFLGWIEGPAGQQTSPHEAQRRFTFLRLQFNAVLTHYDLFSDVMNQRSESRTGIWLCGLDEVAADALRLPGNYYEPPPVVCYLDRGYGAAVRRARTRLPGGGDNPVAIIRVPRERMVGTGIAASLVHEVGHQGAALLDLMPSIRPVLQSHPGNRSPHRTAWLLWDRWISEIMADLWAVARLGIAATTGLWAVVSLPRVFVFRITGEDPHPAPWVRVKLSCAMGNALYPHPQWQALAGIWETLYPLEGLDPRIAKLVRSIEATIPAFVATLIHHRPPALRGRSLGEALASADRRPERLAAKFALWRRRPRTLREIPPTLAFAVLGQARADGKLGAAAESRLLSDSLTHWAVRSTLQAPYRCLRAHQGGPLPPRPRWRNRSRIFRKEKLYGR